MLLRLAEYTNSRYVRVEVLIWEMEGPGKLSGLGIDCEVAIVVRQ